MEEEELREDLQNEEDQRKMIDPKFSKMYEFDVKDTEKNITVDITIPEIFDQNLLNVELHKSRQGISVEAEGMLPIVKGTLLAPVRDIKKKFQNGHLIITIQKQERGLWEVFITDPYPDTEIIDPQSAFSVGISFSKIQSEIMKNFHFLTISASMGYVPAMCFLASFYLRSNGIDGIDTRNIAMQLYNEAIEKYNSPPAMISFADYLLREGSINQFTKNYAIALLRRAIESEYDIAHYYLGHALSPLSEIKGIRKDVNEAIHELELAGDENAHALHDLAMLYFNGVGVKKNLAKANELQIKARKIDKNIEPLQKAKKGFGVKFAIFSILFVLAIILGLAWNEYIKSHGK